MKMSCTPRFLSSVTTCSQNLVPSVCAIHKPTTVFAPKHQTRWTGFDDKILSLYARGMTVREIQAHLEEMYDAEVSLTLISTVIDAVMDEAKAWQARPLDASEARSCHPDLGGCRWADDQIRLSASSYSCRFGCCPEHSPQACFCRAQDAPTSQLQAHVRDQSFGQLLEKPVLSNQIFGLLVIHQQAVYQFVVYGHFSSFENFGSFLPLDRLHKILDTHRRVTSAPPQPATRHLRKR